MREARSAAVHQHGRFPFKRRLMSMLVIRLLITMSREAHLLIFIQLLLKHYSIQVLQVWGLRKNVWREGGWKLSADGCIIMYCDGYNEALGNAGIIQVPTLKCDHEIPMSKLAEKTHHKIDWST
jgi:hypothetical protein